MLRLRPSAARQVATRATMLRASSSSSSLRPLAISLPDLAPHECAYVRSQVDLIQAAKPEDLEHASWSRVEALVRTSFPRFLRGHKTKPEWGVKKHLTKSSLVALRTVAALKELGITEEEVEKKWSMVLLLLLLRRQIIAPLIPFLYVL